MSHGFVYNVLVKFALPLFYHLLQDMLVTEEGRSDKDGLAFDTDCEVIC